MALPEIHKSTQSGFIAKSIDARIRMLEFENMPAYDFQLVLGNNVKEITEATADALFEAGCDDGTPFSSQGVVSIGFSREANSLEEAIRSAIASVNRAGFVVARAEPSDELVFEKINQELARH